MRKNALLSLNPARSVLTPKKCLDVSPALGAFGWQEQHAGWQRLLEKQRNLDEDGVLPSNTKIPSTIITNTWSTNGMATHTTPVWTLWEELAIEDFS